MTTYKNSIYFPMQLRTAVGSMADAGSSKVKVVFIGNSTVGKTELFRRFQGVTELGGTIATIGGACANVTVTVKDNTEVNLMVWDTAGQEAYRGIVPMYFSRASFILIVYDITQRSSFDSVTEWIALSKERAPVNAHIGIIGNKCDLEARRKVTMAEGQELADNEGACMFFETSALNGQCVEDLLCTIGEFAHRDNSILNVETMEETLIEKSDKNAQCNC